MKESSIIDNHSYEPEFDILNMLTPEISSEVSTLTELWSLARMVKDAKGDRIWDVLFQMGCNPLPLDNLGYVFEFNGLSGIYFPAQAESRTIRFTLPRLYCTDDRPKDELADIVNTANSFVTESKFTIMDNDVWLVHERFLSESEDYNAIVRHILDNLESGAKIFHNLCKNL